LGARSSGHEKLAYLARFDWGAAFQEDSWPIIDRLFGEIARLSDEYNCKVLIAAFPVSFQVYATYVDDAPQQRTAALAKTHGLEFFDLLPLLRANAGKPLFYDQCHPNVETNDLIGKALRATSRKRTLNC